MRAPKTLAFLILLLSTAGITLAQDNGNTIIEISGRVTDQEKHEPLSDVSVQVKGTVTGTVTNQSGDFRLRTKARLPFTLVFSSVGFKQQEFEVKSLGSNLQVDIKLCMMFPIAGNQSYNSIKSC